MADPALSRASKAPAGFGVIAVIAVIAACDIGAKVSAQSKRLIWHFNAVDHPGTLRYANRLYRRDHVNAGRRFTPDRTGDPTAVAAGIDRRRCVARLAGTIDAQAAGRGRLMSDTWGLVTFKFALVAAVTGVFSLASASMGIAGVCLQLCLGSLFKVGARPLQMDLLQRRLRFESAMGAAAGVVQLQRHHRIGDDVLREMLGKLDLSEADLGVVK